jgi:hypothetical protein
MTGRGQQVAFCRYMATGNPPRDPQAARVGNTVQLESKSLRHNHQNTGIVVTMRTVSIA